MVTHEFCYDRITLTLTFPEHGLCVSIKWLEKDTVLTTRMGHAFLPSFLPSVQWREDNALRTWKGSTFYSEMYRGGKNSNDLLIS